MSMIPPQIYSIELQLQHHKMNNAKRNIKNENSLKENRNVTKHQPKQEINNTRHNKSQHNNDPTTIASRLQRKANKSDETTVKVISKIQQNKNI